MPDILTGLLQQRVLASPDGECPVMATGGQKGIPLLAGPPPGVALRPAGLSDCTDVASFVADLSLAAKFHRFFAGMSELPGWQARLLCGDGGADVLVATTAGTIVGHIMVADASAPGGPLAGDVGVMVAEQWRCRGVATALIVTAAARAAERGIRMLLMDVRGDNRDMLDVISRLYPDALRARHGPVVHIQIRITAGPGLTNPRRRDPGRRPGIPRQSS